MCVCVCVCVCEGIVYKKKVKSTQCFFMNKL